MMKVKYFDSENEYVASNKDNVIDVVRKNIKGFDCVTIDVTTECKKAVTAVRRVCKALIENQTSFPFSFAEALENLEENIMESAYSGSFELINNDIIFNFQVEEQSDGVWYVYIRLEVLKVEEEETKQENGSEQSSIERIFLENGSVAIQVKVITETTFTTFSLDKNFNYRFGQEFVQNIIDMGYTDMNHCIKSLKKRKILHKEVTREELKQIEVNGLLNLGLYRLREHIDVPVDHVCKELQAYGIEFEQSKKKIMDMFENSDEYFETVKF